MRPFKFDLIMKLQCRRRQTGQSTSILIQQQKANLKVINQGAFMKSKILVIFCAVFSFSCAHTTKPATGTAAPATTRAVAASENADPEYTCEGLRTLEIKPEILTIELLQRLAECEQYDTLNNLYNTQSVHLDRLPSGYAAGKGAKVFNVNNKAVTSVL